MKKTMLLLTAGLFFAGAVMSQDVYSNKNGVPILPATGDWAIGFDAMPMINLALNTANIMNNTGQTADDVIDYHDGFSQTLVGKYYVSETKAYRVRFHMNNKSKTTTTFADDPLSAEPEPDIIEIDKKKVGESHYLLSGGIELRRGTHRLHGFYGAEAFLGIDSEKRKNTYAIKWNQGAHDAGAVTPDEERELSYKSGMSLTVGARGFIGVEYFVFPKISIAAEYGFGLYMKTSPRSKTKTEEWVDPDNDGTYGSNTKETEGGSKDRTMGFGVDNGNDNELDQGEPGVTGSASLIAIFHF